jgi:hypothetical protein|tara:strand:+ start:313 stop:978 length:666 start_codon:yes stop_codon:yes gene_type:complete
MADRLIEITTKESEFEKLAMKALVSHINSSISGIGEEINKKIRPVVFDVIHECYEMQSLRGSYLRGSLGLTLSQASESSRDIAEAVSSSVFVNVKRVTPKNLSGSLTINVQPSDFSNVLSISGAVIRYLSSRYKRTVELPWLDWLLTKGDTILISGFDFQPIFGEGRSGAGSMIKDSIADWRIRPEYSGTKEDNFITRALSHKNTQSKISSMIEKSVNKRL